MFRFYLIPAAWLGLWIFQCLPAFADAPPRANTEPLTPRYELNEDGSIALVVCYNSSCARQREMVFTREDLALVHTQLQTCPLPGSEASQAHGVSHAVQRLRIGVWQMELLAKKYYPPLGNDLPVNDQEFGVEGRTDCVDNTTNTTTFLHIMSDLGWIPGWTVLAPAVRKPWDINRVHWTAVAADQSGQQWSVDSWYRRHGHLPFVMPLKNWRREELAWNGPHQALNPYPKQVSELCE